MPRYIDCPVCETDGSVYSREGLNTCRTCAYGWDDRTGPDTSSARATIARALASEETS